MHKHKIDRFENIKSTLFDLFYENISRKIVSILTTICHVYSYYASFDFLLPRCTVVIDLEKNRDMTTGTNILLVSTINF
jgi:hypothetical protein